MYVLNVRSPTGMNIIIALYSASVVKIHPAIIEFNSQNVLLRCFVFICRKQPTGKRVGSFYFMFIVGFAILFLTAILICVLFHLHIQIVLHERAFDSANYVHTQYYNRV